LDSVLSLLTEGTDLSLWAFFGLCFVSFFGSFIAASLGLGGGLLVIATMTLVLPPAVLIPIHGIVQIGSNGFRAFLLRKEILFHVAPAFIVGTLLGSFIGGNAFFAMETWVLQLVLGLFVLYATWAPGFKSSNPGPAKFFGAGTFAGFATMFIGGSGPLVAPFVNAASATRQNFVATHASLMTFQHLFKVVIFGVLGFAFGPYIPLLVGLLLFGALGTYAGKSVLNRLPEKFFRMALQTILTLLAARLLYAAASTLWGA
jgi:uncharacterized protein